MKRFKITYHLWPGEDITVEITAKNYEDACVFAKNYRKDGFSIEEI